MTITEEYIPEQHVLSEIVVPKSSLEPIERRVYNEEMNLEHALGSRVVHLVEKGVAEASLKLPGVLPSYEEQSLRIETQVLLGEARKKIRSKAQNTEIMFNRIDAIDLPRFLLAQYEKEKDWTRTGNVEAPEDLYDDLHDWVLEETRDGDNRLLHFLKYKVHLAEKRQDREGLRDALSLEKKEWLTAVEKGIDDGWLHSTASRAKDRMGRLKVVLGDYHDIEARHWGGYAMRGKEYIVLGDTIPAIKHAAGHEFSHALLGMFDETWLDEAVTEHIAQVLSGNTTIDKVGPNGTLTDSAYMNPRTLLSLVIDASGGRLSAIDFTLAYSKNTDKGDRSGSVALRTKIDEIFGVEGYLEKLTNAVIMHKQVFSGMGKDQIRALETACGRVIRDFTEDPKKIFGKEPKRPKPKAKHKKLDLVKTSTIFK